MSAAPSAPTPDFDSSRRSRARENRGGDVPPYEVPGASPLPAPQAAPTALTVARLAARDGFHVFPVEVYQRGDRWMKEPRTVHGFYDASDRISAIVPMFRDAQLRRGGVVAVGCWPGASGHVVLDVDIKDGATGREDLDDLIERYGDFIEGAPEVLTPSGGSHYWFRRPVEVEHIDNTDLASGIEVRGDAGFVLLPDIGGYELEASSPPLTDAPVLPTALLEERQARKANLNNGSTTSRSAPLVETGGQPITSGGRNRALFREARSMVRRGWSSEATYRALLAFNEHHCSPPHSADEVQRACNSAFERYDQAPVSSLPETAVSASWR